MSLSKSETQRWRFCCVDVTYTARGSVKTSVWMCIIRSPPAVYSITKHTCSGVWKHANKLTRKGWCDMFTISKMRFSHIRLRQEAETGSEIHIHTLLNETLKTCHAHGVQNPDDGVQNTPFDFIPSYYIPFLQGFDGVHCPRLLILRQQHLHMR